MQPLPAGTATRKFTRRLYGLDATAVYRFLGEIAVAVDRAQAEARAARRAADAQAEASRGRTAMLEARIRSCQEREATIARTLALAEEARREIEARARAEADKSMAAAQVDAGEIIKSSRQTAAKLMEDARHLARRTLEGAKRVAEAKLALAGVESRLLIEESGAVAARIDLLARQETATLSAQVEAIVAEHDARAASLQRPAGLDELRSELDRANKLVANLEAEILPQGSPRTEGEHAHR